MGIICPKGKDVLMTIQHVAAFSDENTGGNPAGVWLGANLPPTADMQKTAAEIGYSESVFAAPADTAQANKCSTDWRVRYFSPESEVPFCGHATIALGAMLANAHGDGSYRLQLNDAAISVEAKANGALYEAALISPATGSESAGEEIIDEALTLFGYTRADLDPRLPPRIARAGATHLIIGLKSRARLADLAYDLDEGRIFMNANSLVTVAFVHADDEGVFHARNAFASGGVLEDPATGAAAAALGGMLRDIGWPHGGRIAIRQGDDMGAPSRLTVELTDEIGAPVRVSGTARIMDVG